MMLNDFGWQQDLMRESDVILWSPSLEWWCAPSPFSSVLNPNHLGHCLLFVSIFPKTHSPLVSSSLHLLGVPSWKLFLVNKKNKQTTWGKFHRSTQSLLATSPPINWNRQEVNSKHRVKETNLLHPLLTTSLWLRMDTWTLSLSQVCATCFGEEIVEIFIPNKVARTQI